MARSTVIEWWYEGSNGWVRIPDWATFFLELGSSVAKGPKRTVVAITTPTRAFASALCATGVVLERSRGLADTDPMKRLAQLRTLPVGAPVSVRPGSVGSKVGRGTLKGFETIDGNEYIVIRVPGRETLWMPAWMADRVTPTEDSHKSSSGRVKFTEISRAAGLMSEILGANEVATFVSSSRLECVVVGNRQVLRQEIVEAPFAITSREGGKIKGHLQDVVRARSFLRKGEFHRSNVVSVASKVASARLASSPRVVIFDGSRSFLRWNISYPAANWIIVLDRADRRLMEAADMLDALYATRDGNSGTVTVKPPPVGIECAAFARRKVAT